MIIQSADQLSPSDSTYLPNTHKHTHAVLMAIFPGDTSAVRTSLMWKKTRSCWMPQGTKEPQSGLTAIIFEAPEADGSRQ